jgi:hypothetical protein
MNPAQYAAQASGGAPAVAGMAPYPLYGIPMGTEPPAQPGFIDNVKSFALHPATMFAAGALSVGGAWFYFGYWRPRSKKMKANELSSMKARIAELETQEK